jgi:hypothetical protein
MYRKIALWLLVVILSTTAFTQTKTKKPVKKPVKKPAVTATPTGTTTSKEPATPMEELSPTKKNERGDGSSTEPKKANSSATRNQAPAKPVYPYYYEFSQPAFDVDHIAIEHDDAGKGTVTFSKRDYNSESFTDPIQLSALTMQKLKGWWDALNFLNSQESYQSERQYAHMGTIKLRLRREAKERTAEFNWTENKDAKALMDEYRNLAQQFVWMFDVELSRQNQPLESPKLLDAFEAMLKRKEISDPQQMSVYLKELSEDERIPLMARNHAAKIVQQIEKEKK